MLSAAKPQPRNPKQQREWVDVWQTPNAREEARALAAMVARNPGSVEKIRALISIDEIEQQELDAWSKDEPGIALRVEAAIKFRSQVLRAFDSLTKK